jgi:hypothetical protein
MIGLDLVTIEVPSTLTKRGSTEFVMAEKENFKIKVGGDFILETEVPNDKKWRVSINLCIFEEDA